MQIHFETDFLFRNDLTPHHLIFKLVNLVTLPPGPVNQLPACSCLARLLLEFRQRLFLLGNNDLDLFDVCLNDLVLGRQLRQLRATQEKLRQETEKSNVNNAELRMSRIDGHLLTLYFSSA